MDIAISKSLLGADGKQYSRTVVLRAAVPATGDQPEQPAVTQEVITLNLDALTGNDYALCEREALVENANMPAIDPRLSPAFQAHLASRASGIPVEALRRLGARDYGALMTEVRDFFLNGE